MESPIEAPYYRAAVATEVLRDAAAFAHMTDPTVVDTAALQQAAIKAYFACGLADSDHVMMLITESIDRHGDRIQAIMREAAGA